MSAPSAVRRSLVEAACGLDADHRLGVELLAARRAGVGERRLQPGEDLDEDRAHALAPGLEGHARRRHALAKESLLGALERVESRRAIADCARRRHAVALLVGAAVAV